MVGGGAFSKAGKGLALLSPDSANHARAASSESVGHQPCKEIHFSSPTALLITVVGSNQLNHEHGSPAAGSMAASNTLSLSPKTHLASPLPPSSTKWPKERGPKEYGRPKTRGFQQRKHTRRSRSSTRYVHTPRRTIFTQEADHNVQEPLSGPQDPKNPSYSATLENGWP